MYSIGSGVDLDDEKAVFWFRKAAKQKDAKSQDRLGVMYSEGRGVKKNLQQAYAWLSTAVYSGNAESRRLQSKIEEQLESADLQQAQKLAESYIKSYGKKAS